MESKLKVSARDQFSEFCRTSTGQSIEKLTDGQRSRTLGLFFATQIYSFLEDDISLDEFEDGWVDGSKDLDVDFIHRDDGRVAIFQCRYRAPGKQEKAADLARFQAVLQRLHSEDFKANSKLQDIAQEIDWDNDNFFCHYVSFGEISNQALEQSQLEPILPPLEGLSDRVQFSFSGETQLNSLLRQAISLTQGVSDKDVTLVAVDAHSGGRSNVLEFTSGEFRSCVLVVDAGQVTRVYDEHKDSLFSLNIRNFLGSTKQNKKIIETAKARPGDFFYFNNGISCIAERLVVSGDRVTANKLQVINGAQTVKALVRSRPRVGIPSSWHSQKPFILVRITEIEKGYSGAGKLRDEITRFNNTQNVIKDADFRANDPVHDSIAKRFRENSRFGRQVVYQAKRTDIRPSNSEVIRVDEFAKRIYSFLVDPITFSGSTSILFDEERGYAHIFGDGRSIWHQMPEAEFRLRAGIWWLAEAIALLLKGEGNVERPDAERQIYSHALERKWFLLFVARVLLERAFGSDAWKSRVERLYKGDWKAGEGGTGRLVSSLYQLSRRVVVQTYRQSRKSPDFNHRRWMRSAETVDAMQEFVADLTDEDLAQLRKE